MAESDIQRTIIDYLKKKKHFFWRNNSGAMVSEYKGRRSFVRFGAPGSPDICIVKDGYFIGLEVKQKGGKQTPDQKAWEQNCKAAGGEYYVVRSLDEVIEVGL